MDAALASLESILSSQLALVTMKQLESAEISRDRRRGLVARKVLRRVRPGVFALVGSPDTWERGLLAAALSVEGSVASHSSAARVWEFALRPEDRYELTVPRRDGTRVAGVLLHRSGTIDEEDVVRRGVLPLTSFERTVCDCTTLLGTHQLGRVLDDGLRRGIASLERLERCARRLESGPGRRMTAVRSLLAERGVGFDPGGSRSELQVLDVFRRARLPLPVQQYRVSVGSRVYRPDFAWPEYRIFAEYYGIAFHTGASAVVADSERLTALAAAGWLPLVFTYASTDREIVERTVAAFRQRGVGAEMGA